MRSSLNRAIPVALILAVAAGLGLRFWHIFAEPLWLDEAYSAWAADHDLAFLWRVVPRYETHPPFYYTLLHVWTGLFGDGLAARRLPGLVAGCLAVAATGWAGARIGGRARGWPVAAAAVVLAATQPVLIEMSREVRPYAPMILAYALAIVALLRPGGPRAWAVLLAEGVLAWLHNLGPLFVLSLAGAWLIVAPPAGWRGWMRFAAGQAAVLAIWLPAGAILLDQAPTWIGSTWLTFSWAGFGGRLAMLYAAPGPVALVGLVLAGVGAGLLIRVDGQGRRAAALVVLAGAPVLASAILSSLIAPVFLTRTLSPATVPALLLMARGVAMPGRWRIAGAMLALVLATGFAAQAARWRARGPMQDWYGTVRWLAPKWRAGDAIWAYPNEGALPFDLAARDLALPFRARAIPTPVPSLGLGFTPTGSRGAVSLYPADIARLAATREGRETDVIWLLRLGPNAYDRGDAMLRALEARRVRIGTWVAGPITLIGLRRRADGRIGPGPAARSCAVPAQSGCTRMADPVVLPR